jgi:hypothetical protein
MSSTTRTCSENDVTKERFGNEGAIIYVNNILDIRSNVPSAYCAFKPISLNKILDRAYTFYATFMKI